MGTHAQRARVIGRYALYEKIASGGMASVHLGRLLGPVGFARTVAIKCLHPNFARNPEFSQMFIDEARVAARIRHPSVVQTIDVVGLEGELFLVMDYVHGESFARLLVEASKRREHVTPQIIVPIMVSVLHGLHAAHEATSERGEPLGIVHRDVSPHNVMVGLDGVARVLDFGVAKAAGRLQETRAGQLKGKIPYMSPEQVKGSVDRLSDIYACSVVLWEALTGRRLFQADSDLAMISLITAGKIIPPSELVPDLPKELEAIVMKGLARRAADRFPNAREMARVLEKSVALATSTEIGEWVEQLAGKSLAERARYVKEMERDSLQSAAKPTSDPAEFGDFDLHDTLVQQKPDHDETEAPPISASSQSIPTLPVHPVAPAAGSPPGPAKPSAPKSAPAPLPSKPGQSSSPPPRPAQKSNPAPPRPPAASASAASSSVPAGPAPIHTPPPFAPPPNRATVRMSSAPPRPPSGPVAIPAMHPPPSGGAPPAPPPPSSASSPFVTPDGSSSSSVAATARAGGDDDETEPMPTQLSSGSASGGSQAMSLRGDRRVVIGIAVAAAVVLLFTIALVLAHSSVPEPSRDLPSPASRPSSPAPRPSAAASNTASPPAPVAPDPTTGGDAATGDRHGQSSPATAVPNAPSNGPSGPGVAKPLDCDPPYTLDSLGNKHYKRECLK